MTIKRKQYSNQSLHETTFVDGVETNARITIARPPFLLERYYFDKIISGESKWEQISKTFLGGSLVFLLSAIAKALTAHFLENVSIDEWELIALVLSLLLAGISAIIDYYVPNERKRIIKKIKEHFENEER